MHLKIFFSCLTLIPFPFAITEASEVTFSKDIAPLVYNNCTECHRPKTAAPFSFTSYEQVKKRAKTMLEVMLDGYMPPWHPVKEHGHFKNERGLSPEQIETFSQWVEQDMPKGNLAEAPPLPTFSDGWQLGTPDLIVEMPEAFTVPADGKDIYRNFHIPLNHSEDKWIKAIEIMPSSRPVVHHCLYYLDEHGIAKKLDAADPSPGFKNMGERKMTQVGGWAVGGTPQPLHGDYAYHLKAGADMMLAMHFHPSGKEEKEKSKIGIYFSDTPSSRKVTAFQVPGFYGKNAGLNIPAGDPDFVLKGKVILPNDIYLLTSSAHMHYLGTSAKGWATLPDGRKENLLYIDEWDFNWQGDYHYQEPLFLPKGSLLETEIHYDNSEKNPFNPNHPPKNVRWGLQSDDEMGSIIYTYVPAHEKDNATTDKAFLTAMLNPPRNQDEMQEVRSKILARFDKNKDGRLAISEAPRKFQAFLKKTDKNKNGILEPAELSEVEKAVLNRGGF